MLCPHARVALGRRPEPGRENRVTRPKPRNAFNLRRPLMLRRLVLAFAAVVAGAFTNPLAASPLLLRGTVVGPGETPLAAVTLRLDGTAQSVVTGDDGSFRLELAAAPATLVLRAERAGFQPLQREIAASETASEVRIVLKPTTNVHETVTVTASRLDVPLEASPASTTVVEAEALRTMPRGIGAEEALAAVPGVKIDNQADGERIHLSVRGQGILSERGIRGVQVLLDGVPLNDPSGFVPDLYDVDWMSVDRIAVLRGPSAFLYGGGS
jgi:outer membrane receptor protein involved in Fe transport